MLAHNLQIVCIQSNPNAAIVVIYSDYRSCYMSYNNNRRSRTTKQMQVNAENRNL